MSKSPAAAAKAMAAYRGEMLPLSPHTNDAIDGQQLCRSSTNGNYYLKIAGGTEPVMISLSMAAGWLTLHNMPQLADTQSMADWHAKNGRG